MPLLFAAVVLLGVGMLAVVLELPASARAARTAAFVSSIVGLLWALAPWLMLAGLIAFAGLLVVAAAAWRAGRWSSLEFGILIAGVALGWSPILSYSFGLWVPGTPDPNLQFVILLSLVTAWVVVGASLVRTPRHLAASVDPATM